MTRRTKIIKRGRGSLAIPLPAAMARELGLEAGTVVEVEKEGERIIVIRQEGEESVSVF